MATRRGPRPNGQSRAFTAGSTLPNGSREPQPIVTQQTDGRGNARSLARWRLSYRARWRESPQTATPARRSQIKPRLIEIEFSTAGPSSGGCKTPKNRLKTNRPKPQNPQLLLAALRRKSVASLAREMTQSAQRYYASAFSSENAPVKGAVARPYDRATSRSRRYRNRC